MAGDKKKKAAGKPLGKGGKLPSKTSINLLIVEKNTSKNVAAIVAFIAFMAALGVFVKFMVVDKLNEINRMEARYTQKQKELAALQEDNAVYEEVRAEHSHYGNSYLNEDELMLQDRLDMLRVIEDELLEKDALQSIVINGNVAQLKINSLKLRNVSQIVASLEDKKNVEYVTVSQSVTDEIEKNVVSDYDVMYQDLYNALYQSLSEGTQGGLQTGRTNQGVGRQNAGTSTVANVGQAAGLAGFMGELLAGPGSTQGQTGTQEVKKVAGQGLRAAGNKSAGQSVNQAAEQGTEKVTEAVAAITAEENTATGSSDTGAGLEAAEAAGQEIVDGLIAQTGFGAGLGANMGQTGGEYETEEDYSLMGDRLDPEEIVMPIGAYTVERAREARAAVAASQDTAAAAEDGTAPASPTGAAASAGSQTGAPETEFDGEAGAPPAPETEAAAETETAQPVTELQAGPAILIGGSGNDGLAGLGAVQQTIVQPVAETEASASTGLNNIWQGVGLGVFTPQPSTEAKTVQEKVVVTTMTIYFKSALQLAGESLQDEGEEAISEAATEAPASGEGVE